MKNFKKASIQTILLMTIALLFIVSLQATFAADQSINATSTDGIKGAIGNASAGDTVTLAPGTYNKTNQDTNFTISKNITLQGNSSTDSVIIDAQGLSRIFTIGNAYNITFINITFVNGLLFNGSHGGAIYNNYAGTVMTLINCSFINNQVINTTTTNGFGGAIYSGGGNSTISLTNCTFLENIARTGGSIYLQGNLTITNSSFSNNSAFNGGAVYINAGSNTTVTNSNFTDNNSTSNGAAIATNTNNQNLVITDSRFVNNNAGGNGAVYGGGFSNLTIDSCVFSKNYAGTDGTVNIASASYSLISNSIFDNNYAYDDAGAVRYVSSYNSSVINCTFSNNIAADGGAFDVYSSSILFINNKFVNNSVTRDGAAIFVHDNSNVSVDNCSFINNTATNFGGTIFNNGTMSLSGNTMTDNTAGLGNMIYNNGTTGVLNLTFIDNSTWVVKNGSTITLFANLTDDMGNTITGQNISFYLDGVFFENVTAIEGYANLSYTVPSSAGNIPVSGIYAGNGAFNILINNGLLKVRIPTKIIISVPKEVKVGDTVTLESKLTDENGNPLAGKTVDFYVDGVKVGSGVTDSNGVAKLNYTFTKAGKPKVESKFAGDSTYMASNATNQTTVSKIPTITTVETNKDTITATLTDEDGNPLSNKEVTIIINGKTYTKTTNSQGQVIMKYKNAWDYKVTANFAGDEKYLGSKATAPKRTPTKITIKVKGDKITATLIDENGTPLPGKKIVFRVKGIVIGVGTTDANGVATIFYKNAEKYTITADFEGDAQYGPSSAKYTPASENVPAAGKVAMKKTGIPIIAVILVLLASLGLIGIKKE